MKLAVLAIVTIWPLLCRSMSGRKALVVYQLLRTFTSKIFRRYASDVVRMVWDARSPALLMRIVGAPIVSLTFSATE